MSDHPSQEELEALWRGDLPAEKARSIAQHILFFCETCLAKAPAPLRISLGLDGAGSGQATDSEAAYDEVIDKVARVARQHEARLCRRKVEANRIEKKLREGGFDALQKLPKKVNPLALYDALLAYSWSLRHENPGLMQQAAWAALRQIDQVDTRAHGLREVMDFRCRAWAELGNAYRVGDDFHRATWALGRARQVFALGTKDPFLEIRIVELEGSLAADQCEYEWASLKMMKVFRFYRRQKDHHLAGRALINQGLYTGYAGDPDKGIHLLNEGLSLIDRDSDPLLVRAAMHNQLMFLIDTGRFADARKFRLKYSRELSHTTGAVYQALLRAMDGRIDAGIGNFARAETIFREVTQDLKNLGRGYNAAIAGLDLAIALLSQQKTIEARQVVLESAGIFTRLQIGPNAMAAIVLLRETFEMREGTLSLLKNVTEYMRRAAVNPNVRFSLRDEEF
ncbi:MAG TPA: hypothetical protein VF756_00545 [Thermoanaerobaculia bacterium]